MSVHISGPNWAATYVVGVRCDRPQRRVPVRERLTNLVPFEAISATVKVVRSMSMLMSMFSVIPEVARLRSAVRESARTRSEVVQAEEVGRLFFESVSAEELGRDCPPSCPDALEHEAALFPSRFVEYFPGVNFVAPFL